MTDKTITMQSARTIINWLSPDDFTEAYNIFSAEDALKYIAPLQALTKEEHLKRFQAKYDEMQRNRALHFSCRLKKNNELVALLNLGKPSKDEERNFLGYIIKKQYWGQGFGTELTTWLVEYCKMKPDMDSVYALIEAENIASRKILQKLGFQLFETKDDDGIGVEIFKVDLFNE